MTFNLRSVALATVWAAAATSAAAQTNVVKDADGNVGYATAEACDAAVLNGSAKFYTPSTRMAPKRRAGEATVTGMTLKELGTEYNLGACDKGAPHAFGRGGVSKALQGQWIPYSPSMPINAYKDKSGKVVRVTMRDCDNNFSGMFPRGIPAPAPKVVAPAPAPVVVAPAPVPAPAPAPVVLKAAPVVAFPYVFGTLGGQRDLVGNGPVNGIAQHDDHDSKLAMQAGAGYQFNKLWGAEAFVQAGQRLNFENGFESEARALGLRATLGQDISEAARVFAKLGVASVDHPQDKSGSAQTRPTVGLGMTYKLSNNLALRGDFDHFVKKTNSAGKDWKALNYLGIGLQYSFMP
jgi:Outer membrane protein beta-barrel domain